MKEHFYVFGVSSDAFDGETFVISTAFDKILSQEEIDNFLLQECARELKTTPKNLLIDVEFAFYSESEIQPLNMDRSKREIN